MAMVVVGYCDDSAIESACAVHQEQLIAHLQTQHADGVLCFFGRQLSCFGRWCIEESDFLHDSFCSMGGRLASSTRR